MDQPYVNPVYNDIHPDPNDRKILVHSVQDCAPVLEQNKVLRDIPKKSDWARPIASIPNILLTQWLYEEHARGNTHLRMFTVEFNREVVLKKLRDPDYKYLLV